MEKSIIVLFFILFGIGINADGLHVKNKSSLFDVSEYSKAVVRGVLSTPEEKISKSEILFFLKVPNEKNFYIASIYGKNFKEIVICDINKKKYLNSIMKCRAYSRSEVEIVKDLGGNEYLLCVDEDNPSPEYGSFDVVLVELNLKKISKEGYEGNIIFSETHNNGSGDNENDRSATLSKWDVFYQDINDDGINEIVVDILRIRDCDGKRVSIKKYFFPTEKGFISKNIEYAGSGL